MKTNHEDAWKFILFAVAGIIVLGFIVIAFNIVRDGKQGTNSTISQFNSVTGQYADVKRENYDGLEVKGSSLRELIKEEVRLGEIEIQYKTNASGATGITASATTLNVTRGSEQYINPYAYFIGEVIRDENGVVETLLFTQIKK